MANRLRSILVGIDFSASSERALEHAVALATALDAELTLLHAWNPATGVLALEAADGGATWMNELRQSAERELENQAARAREAGVTVRTLFEPGAASRVVTDASRSADLVVLGRRGSAGLAHVILGSVSERVVRLASRSVLVVPEQSAAEHVVPRRLLVGVDFSDAAREALDVAERIATAVEADAVALVHASPDERELWLATGSEIAYQGQWPYDRAALEAWGAPRRGATRTVAVEAHVVEGRAESVLVETARGQNCDWIVAGVQGRTALAAMLLGSTTDRVLKLADRPVLAVPLQEGTAGEPTG